MCLLATMLDSANKNISVTPESSTEWHCTRGYFTNLFNSKYGCCSGVFNLRIAVTKGQTARHKQKHATRKITVGR